MKRIIFTLLIIISCITPVYATLPVDINYDGIISSQELSSEILNHLQSEGPVPLELIDAAWMYWHWNGTPLSITDSSNKTIIFDYPVKRLVAYDGSTLETLRSLNSTGIVVGVSKNTFDEPVFFPEFQLTQGVGTVWSPDIEALMKTRPDTIILYATISPDSVKTIEDQVHAFDPSVRVLRFDLFKPESYPEEVRKLSKIIGKEQEAEAFLQFYEPILQTIRSRVGEIQEEDRKTVYFEGWNAYKSAAPGSGYHEKITFAGGRNIFNDAPNPYPVVNPEAVLRLAPEYIIKQVGAGESNIGGYNDQNTDKLKTVHRDLLNRTGWNTLPAVKKGNVHVIHSDIQGSASHFIGMQYLARWFYPELFSDIDPLKTHQEYLTRFQHLNYNPTEQGGFVYP